MIGIRSAAIVFGLLALGLPMVRIWRMRHVPRGRGTGPLSFLTYWPVVFVLTTVYIFIGILLWKPIPLTFSADLRFILVLAGAALYLPGILLYLWGFLSLGSMFGVSSEMTAQLYEGHRLIVKGPYAVVRHPMYLGVILVAVGALLIFQTWAMVIYTPSSLGVIFRARREEHLLEEEFGTERLRYKECVPAWIPWIRKSLKD